MNLHSELKKEFQLERLILFSDAVFAIAITLLVIEIKVPEFNRHTVTDHQLLESLDELIPKFIGFIVSFIIIGIYWIIHHRLFGFVVGYKKLTIILNLIFLFFIVLMPFSTAFYSNYILRGLKAPVLVYVSNIVFLGIANLALWLHVTKAKPALTDGMDERTKKFGILRSIIVPVIFTLTAVTYLFINPMYAVWVPLTAAIIIRLMVRKLNKK